MPDWEVIIQTDSGYIKKVRVDNYITREDAESAALGMSGAKKVLNSNPKTYHDETDVESFYVENQQQVNVNNYYDDFDNLELDETEEELYSLMCEIAIEEGREQPSYDEFYEILNGKKKSSNPIKNVWNSLTGWMDK